MQVCGRLAAEKLATNCAADQPGGIGAAAREKVAFDVPGLAAKTGQVLLFQSATDFDATVSAFNAAAVLAGRHRYGSRSKLVLVQMNSATPNDLGDRAKSIVEGL
jgi:hypothetical protein